VKYLQIITIIALVCLLSFGVFAADGLVHVVARGETIYSISRHYQVTAEELMRANGITDPSRLQLGGRLVIPSRTSSSNTQVSSSASTQVLVDYRVVRGDTLFSIARTNGITLQRLLEINGFSADHTLRAGDVIKIPGRGTQNNTPAPVNNTTVVRAPGSIYSLHWPVNPRVITYMTGQMGIVVEGERLESVRCLMQGNVVSAGPWRKFGRVVIVETTGGYFYMYGGLETITVNVGDRVTTGIELGKLGINAVSDKAQLFFMVFRNDRPIDPASAPRAGSNSRI